MIELIDRVIDALNEYRQECENIAADVTTNEERDAYSARARALAVIVNDLRLAKNYGAFGREY